MHGDVRHRGRVPARRPGHGTSRRPARRRFRGHWPHSRRFPPRITPAPVGQSEFLACQLETSTIICETLDDAVGFAARCPHRHSRGGRFSRHRRRAFRCCARALRTLPPKSPVPNATSAMGAANRRRGRGALRQRHARPCCGSQPRQRDHRPEQAPSLALHTRGPGRQLPFLARAWTPAFPAGA